MVPAIRFASRLGFRRLELIDDPDFEPEWLRQRARALQVLPASLVALAGRALFETAIAVPERKQAPVKVSSGVLSTQLQQGARGRNANPLTRDGVQLVPNLTHVVSKDQKLYFYYEVYDPAEAAGEGPQVRTSLAFYRGKVKVFETPVVERVALDVADRKAAVFQFEIPAGSFGPGLYTCQINIIDAAAGKFAFPRLAFYVR